MNSKSSGPSVRIHILHSDIHTHQNHWCPERWRDCISAWLSIRHPVHSHEIMHRDELRVPAEWPNPDSYTACSRIRSRSTVNQLFSGSCLFNASPFWNVTCESSGNDRNIRDIMDILWPTRISRNLLHNVAYAVYMLCYYYILFIIFY